MSLLVDEYSSLTLSPDLLPPRTRLVESRVQNCILKT
jgi:hypothetical protein